MGHKQLTDNSHKASYPDFLQKISKSDNKNAKDSRPILVSMGNNGSAKELKTLVENFKITTTIDNYAEQFAELLLSKNAQLYRANYAVQKASIKNLLENHYGKHEPWNLGSWVYFPWSGQLVHILAQKEFEELRTIRNRDLITSKEQSKLYEFSVACFGMSVGSAGALSIAITGTSRSIKLIDGAVISGSNLNRILTTISNVGENKAEVIGRNIYEMNPYSVVEYSGAATSQNIETIIIKPWTSDLVIDEIDDIEMKVRIRLESRKNRIPVLMATEIGDSIILDVERFDTEPDRPIFHNMIPGIESLVNKKLENHREWMKTAVKIIDPNNMTLKMQESLLKIGSTIVTHPQLGSTVMMTGGILAFAVKSIALGHSIKSGRYLISLEKNLLTDHQTRKYKRQHKKHTKVIQSAVNLM